jgi:phage terminase large subunit-like protein
VFWRRAGYLPRGDSVRAGPKASASTRALVERDLPEAGGERVIAWIEQFVKVPKGTGARAPMKVRPWQAELIHGVFDGPRPRLALWSLPRGQGKSTLSAALALYALHGDGVEGASVCLIAKDERQARIVHSAALRMTELSEPLMKRSVLYQDRIVVPRTGSTLQVLPADPHRLEGLDPTLAIIDEIGVVDRKTYEVVALASGKRETSLTLCIGTPSPDGVDSVMWDLRQWGLEHPEDSSFYFREHAAPAGAAVDDEDAWAEANPALNDFLHIDAMRALLPPKTRESTFRRARMGMWIDGTDNSWLAPGEWKACEEPGEVPDGADVVLALDGSYSGDSTALVVCSIGPRPHISVAGYWSNPGDEDWRVDILDVEQAVRDACDRWKVREIACDPYGWKRSMQVLELEGLPITEFGQSGQRMTPATQSLGEAIANRQVTQSGHLALAEHMRNARYTEDSRGVRVHKVSRWSRQWIDLSVASIMAHDRARALATTKPKKRKVVSFR